MSGASASAVYPQFQYPAHGAASASLPPSALLPSLPSTTTGELFHPQNHNAIILYNSLYLSQLQQMNTQEQQNLLIQQRLALQHMEQQLLQQQAMMMQQSIQQRQLQTALQQVAAPLTATQLPNSQPSLPSLNAEQQAAVAAMPNVPTQQSAGQALGLSAAEIASIYEADESNFHTHHPSDDEEEEDEDDDNHPSRRLLRLVEDHHWVSAIQRIATHPHETQQVGIQGRTPLHVAAITTPPQLSYGLW